MTTVGFDDRFLQDLERIAEHLELHAVERIDERIAGVFRALEILGEHPLIGRPVDGGRRELVIGQGTCGYLARYVFDPLDDEVTVLALRAQREVGFDEL